MFICSTMSNLNNFEPQQLEPQKRVQNEKKKQNRRPEPRNHTKDPPLAPLFFGTMRLFLKLFGLHQRVPLSFVSTFCNTMDVKNPNCDAVQKSHYKFFLDMFSIPQRAPFIFFHILQPVGVSQSLKPFTILSLRYSADFGRSRLVFFTLKKETPETIS